MKQDYTSVKVKVKRLEKTTLLAGKFLDTPGKKAANNARKHGKKDTSSSNSTVQKKIIQYMTRVAQEKEKKSSDGTKDPAPEAREPRTAHGNTINLGGRGKTTLEKWLQTKARGTKEGRSQPNQEPDKDMEQGKDPAQETDEDWVKETI